MRRSASLAAGVLLAASAAAQEPQYFEEPPKKPKFSLRWDFLSRFDRVDHLPYGESIDRGRFELRPEIGFDAASDLRFGARALFEYGTEAYSYPYQDNYISRQAALDRGYVVWTPGNFAFRGGKFGMPLVSSEMLWDRDIQTKGAAASWTSGSGAWTIAGAAFFGPQHYGDESQIAAGQVVFRAGDAAVFNVEAAAAYWSFEPRDLIVDYIRENSVVLVDGTPTFASEFHVANLLVRLRFPIGDVPILVSLDGFDNFAAQQGRRLAFEGAVLAGQVGTPGNFRGFYVYQYIQRDATVGAYNTDDWWYHTWYRGHRVGVAWTFLPRVYVQGSFSVQRRLDQSHWINRYLVDVVKMF
jgi:Putative porin